MSFNRLTGYIALFAFVLSMFLLVGCGEQHPTLPAQVVAKHVTYWDHCEGRYDRHFVVVRDINGTYTYRIRQQEYETIQIGEIWKAPEKVEVSRNNNGNEKK